MRCDRYQGLNERARRIVNGVLAGATESGTTDFADGTTDSKDRVPAKVEVIGYVRGFYKGRAGNRHRYTMQDGRVFEEFLEHKIHCSGPNYFIALRDVATGAVVPESSWTQRELREYGCNFASV